MGKNRKYNRICINDFSSLFICAIRFLLGKIHLGFEILLNVNNLSSEDSGVEISRVLEISSITRYFKCHLILVLPPIFLEEISSSLEILSSRNYFLVIEQITEIAAIFSICFHISENNSCTLEISSSHLKKSFV